MSGPLPTVGQFAEYIDEYCDAFSASVTSGKRTAEHNRSVGGVVRSAHIAGLAVDVVYDGSCPGREADEWLGRRGLKRIPEGDHDHVMPIGWPPK